MNNKYKNIAISLLVMALWGSLFPCIKIGYGAFGISSKSIADILMFASMRFVVCGLVVCLISLGKKEKCKMDASSFMSVIAIGVFAIVLHYACTYVGLSSTDSSKTALLKQTGALVYVCFSFLFFKEEKFSIYKIVGAIVGFCGVIAINYSKSKLSFSVGDILILCASFCTVVSNVISRKSVKSTSPLVITGVSQLFGGLVLLAVALAFGGGIPEISLKGIGVFSYICFASTVSYVLWYYIQKTALLSQLFIIKFAEPLFACVFGAVLLGENIFRIQYLAAFVLISLGIITGNYAGRKEKKND